MSNTTSQAEPTVASPRISKRRWAWRMIAVIFACGLLLFGWYYLRGTWAAVRPTDPATPADGAVAQLVLGENGAKEIRTAVVIPVAVEDSWKILSNYEEWERLFKTVREKKLTEQLDENRHHVVSDVMTPLGVIHLDFIVTHEKLPEGGYLASWDAPTPELPVNKGTIRITPLGPDQTLLVYTVRKRYRAYPTFLVNNLLLRQQPDLVGTLGERMIEAAREH